MAHLLNRMRAPLGVAIYVTASPLQLTAIAFLSSAIVGVLMALAGL